MMAVFHTSKQIIIKIKVKFVWQIYAMSHESGYAIFKLVYLNAESGVCSEHDDIFKCFQQVLKNLFFLETVKKMSLNNSIA